MLTGPVELLPVAEPASLEALTVITGLVSEGQSPESAVPLGLVAVVARTAAWWGVPGQAAGRAVPVTGTPNVAPGLSVPTLQVSTPPAEIAHGGFGWLLAQPVTLVFRWSVRTTPSAGASPALLTV